MANDTTTREPREQNAMLTKVDREFLDDPESYYSGKNAKQMRYERRENIRERVRESILDFTLLYDELPEKEREKIFETDEGRWIGREDEALHNGVRDALALFLYSARVTELMEPGERTVPELEDVLGGALDRAGLRDGYIVQDWDLSIEAIPLQHLIRGFEEGDRQLEGRELGLVMESGKVNDETLETIQELVRDDLFGDGE